MAFDSGTLGTVTFLIPVVTLFIAFLILKWDALKVAALGWLVEAIVVLAAYPGKNVLTATVWADFSLWIVFAVIWTGFIFREMYLNTGLLQRLVDILDSLFKSNWGKALALSGTVGGLLGAFNGYATYPIAITGIKELGYSAWRSAAGYLVFFSWCIPFVSLWIGAQVAHIGSGVPVIEFAPYMGAFALPLIALSGYAFSRIIEIDLKEEHNSMLLALTILGNMTGVILFTLVLPQYYLMTLVACGFFVFLYLWLFGKFRRIERGTLSDKTFSGVIRPFGPIIVGIVVILLWSWEPVKNFIANFEFTLQLWSYEPVQINLLSNAGFFILIIALSSYLFRMPPEKTDQKKRSNPVSDILTGSRLSVRTLLTLVFGGGIVGMMLVSGQIGAVRDLLLSYSSMVYSVVLVPFSFISGIVFTEGTPAALLLSSMQVEAAATLGVPLAFLVAIVTFAVMGPADPLKPSVLSFTATLAGAPLEDEPKMFRTALIWQLAAVIIIVIEVILAVLFMVG